MSWQAPNLARDPFLNLRPLARVVGGLAAAAVLLTTWNVLSYARIGSGAAIRAAEIERLVAETAAAKRRLATIESDLASRDLESENRRTVFLNARIAERTFSWNLLFDRLTEALPPGVRLRELAPHPSEARAAPAAGAVEESGAVLLRISGEAEEDEALLAFVDRLFAHPAFDSPNLARENRERGSTLAFELSVVYFPQAAP